MAYIIAFAGKGGTGKTTIAALTIRYLIEKKHKAILAVDADSNSCLNEALGVDVHATIGKLREESLATVRSGAARPGGMSMEQLFDYQVQQSVIEAKGFDLMVMGRPEGPGCYCAANNIIRKYTDKLSEKYPYVVIDNEAGMEHLSRRTTHKVDLLLIISDPTQKGMQTAKRINLGQTGDQGILIHTDTGYGGPTGVPVRGGSPADDEAAASLGDLLVIGDDPLVDRAVGVCRGDIRRHVTDPIGHLEIPDADG